MQDLTAIHKSENGTLRTAAAAAERLTKAKLEKMTEKGRLGLPDALEEARWKYGLVDGYFKVQPVFERVFVYQVPLDDGLAMFEGTGLWKPESVMTVEKENTCRGVLVSAGAAALDALKSNGIDVGYLVNFIRFAPFRVEVDRIQGTAQYALGLNAGDIVGSETLRDRMNRREVAIRWDEEAQQHVYIDEDGNKKVNQTPTREDDY